MARMLALVALVALAACAQSIAPVPSDHRPTIQGVASGLHDVIRDKLSLAIGGTVDSPCTGETIALDSDRATLC